MKKIIIDFIRRLVGTKSLLKNAGRDKKDLLFEIRKIQMIEHILHDSERGVTEIKYCNHDIIVSLTTHGKRIYDVAFTIESIMQQSMKDKMKMVLSSLHRCLQLKLLPLMNLLV